MSSFTEIWDADDQDAVLAAHVWPQLLSSGLESGDRDKFEDAAQKLNEHSELFAWFLTRRAKHGWSVTREDGQYVTRVSNGPGKKPLLVRSHKMVLALADAISAMTDQPEGKTLILKVDTKMVFVKVGSKVFGKSREEVQREFGSLEPGQVA